MNNQLSKGGEYSSIEGFARSSKAFHGHHHHLKTEQPEPTHQRSPDPSHLRETWRKPRMHHNKLPDAFQVRNKKKKTNRELIDDLDRMVQHSRFKEFQKQLEPLGGGQPSSRPPTENGNPLASYQKYLRIKSKYSQQMQERDLSLNKYRVLSNKQPVLSFKLNQCITLSVIKRGGRTGTVKKILHVPTLRVLCVREEPLNTKQARLAVKDLLVLWQGSLAQQECFLNCHGGVYNVPEGAVSIITDYQRHGSLLDLLQSVMTLPESVIREIFPEVVEALGIYYESSETAFGGLSPSQILITEKGRICLGMGLYYHFTNPSSGSSIYSIRAHRPNPMEFNATQKNFMRSTVDKSSTEQERSIDVFKIGLIMLECAIGGFESFQQSPLLWQALRAVFTEEGQMTVKRDKACCLIHNQGYLLDWASHSEEKTRRDSLNLSEVFPYLKFLKERFSVEFIGLLCDCLKLSHSKRLSFPSLLDHSYLRLQTPKQARTVGVTLSDLLQISGDWSQQPVQSSQEWGEKVIGHILHVLNGCKKEVLHDMLANRRDEIVNLGQELGLSGAGLGERMMIALTAMAKSDRNDFANSL